MDGASVDGASVDGASVDGATVDGAVIGAGSVTVGALTSGVLATVSSDLAWTAVSDVVQPLNPKPTTSRLTALRQSRFRCVRVQFMPMIESSVCRW